MKSGELIKFYLKDICIKIFEDSSIVYIRDGIKYFLSIRPILGFYNNYNFYNISPRRKTCEIIFYSKFFNFEINLMYRIFKENLSIDVLISLESNRNIETLDFPYPIIVIDTSANYRVLINGQENFSLQDFYSLKILNEILSIEILFKKTYICIDSYKRVIPLKKMIKTIKNKLRIENLLGERVLLDYDTTLKTELSIKLKPCLPKI